MLFVCHVKHRNLQPYNDQKKCFTPARAASLQQNAPHNPESSRSKSPYGCEHVAPTCSMWFTNAGAADSLRTCFIRLREGLLFKAEQNTLVGGNEKMHMWNHVMGYRSRAGECVLPPMFWLLNAFSAHLFRLQVNGYSNEYWGWGAEDDDMYVRILHSCLGLERANYDVARFVLLFPVQLESFRCPNNLLSFRSLIQRQQP